MTTTEIATEIAVPDGVAGPAAEPVPARARQRSREVLTFFLRRPGLVASILFIALVLGWAFAPGLFTSADPIQGVPRDKLTPPNGQYWFGTDHLGRDVYARVVYGAALSLQATAIAVVVGLVVGAGVGVLAGFVGGRMDGAVMRLVDVLLAIPALLLSLAVVTALGFGTVNVAIAVGIASVAAFARVMRADVFRVRTQLFVEAARAGGVSRTVILIRHVLPHSTGSVLVLAALEFGGAILAVSALSFLGFGAPPPAPEWGALVSEGRNYLTSAWWLTTMPGAVVALSVLAANRIGRALDGEWRRSR